MFAPGSYPTIPSSAWSSTWRWRAAATASPWNLDEVRLVTSNGETRLYQKDLQVEPGSALVVPERNFSRSELVQIGLTVASVLISGAALYVTMKK